MLIIENNLIPFKGFKFINLCGILFCRKGKVLLPVDEEHERIHTKQMGDFLYIFPVYYLWYVMEWLIRLVMLRDRRKAYRAITFEREAYDNQCRTGYHKTRKHFCWIKYILK